MNRYIIGWFGMVSLATALFVSGCAVSSESDEVDEDGDQGESARVVGTPTESPQMPLGGALSAGKPGGGGAWSLRPENHGCIDCGPLPDPWNNRGPLPDPWTDPGPSSSSGGSGGDGKR